MRYAVSSLHSLLAYLPLNGLRTLLLVLPANVSYLKTDWKRTLKHTDNYALDLTNIEHARFTKSTVDIQFGDPIFPHDALQITTPKSDNDRWFGKQPAQRLTLSV